MTSMHGLAALVLGLGLVATANESPDAKDTARIEKLIQRLDSNRFVERQAALRGLDEIGARALPALQKTLENMPSLELRRRVEDLIGRIERRDPAYIKKQQMARAEELIVQLGAETVAARESAALELQQIGALALDALRRASETPDLEVRMRAKNLVLSISHSPPAQ